MAKQKPLHQRIVDDRKRGFQKRLTMDEEQIILWVIDFQKLDNDFELAALAISYADPELFKYKESRDPIGVLLFKKFTLRIEYFVLRRLLERTMFNKPDFSKRYHFLSKQFHDEMYRVEARIHYLKEGHLTPIKVILKKLGLNKNG